MRNMVKFIMVAVFALFCVTPFATKAEAAAKMAILPLINTVESEDAEKASAIYMEVVFDVFEFPQYDFVDEDAAIKAFRANGQSLSKAAL